MGLRGPKPKGKVAINWSPNFAYAIGLLVTDGSVSKNGRHVIFTSKEEEQLNNFKKALNITVPVSHTRSGFTGKKISRIQFSDSLFNEFLQTIGVISNKTKIIDSVRVPKNYFFDFLRGHFDGDGSFYSYFDPRWKSSFMFYISFVSASKNHIAWLQNELNKHIGVCGHVTQDGRGRILQLKYAKKESLKIIKNMYYSDSVICLSRKKKKIEKALKIAELDKNMPKC